MRRAAISHWEQTTQQRHCGTSLTFRHTSYEGKKIDVTTVILDDPEAFPPEGHTWTSQKLRWMKLADGLPSFEEGAPS